MQRTADVTRLRDQLDKLPASIPSMWRLCKRGYQYEPALIVTAFGLALLGALPDALLAFWFKKLGDAATVRDGMGVRIALLALGFCSCATWIVQTMSGRVQRRFRDKVTIALESHVATLIASIPTIAHLDSAAHLDRLAVLRKQVFMLGHMYMSLFTTCGWILRLAVTVWLLSNIHPLLSLLVLFGCPAIFTSAWRPAVEAGVQLRVAQSMRFARHLFDLATTAAPAKEVRVSCVADRIRRERSRAWGASSAPLAAARWATAGWHAMAWAIFGGGYVGAIVFVATREEVSAGALLLTLAGGARLSFYIGGTVNEVGFLRGVWMQSAQCLGWLEGYATSLSESAHAPAPTRLMEGIQFEHVSFVYPGTERLVLQDVNLMLPAGSVVAIVGENGAGKSTLVKLLAKMYEPTGGRILVEGLDLASIASDTWRARLSGAFQDFCRFEFSARRTIGVGDLPRMDADESVTAAIARAGADDVIASLADGLDTQLGQSWPRGVDISVGQWQKLALARSFMRDAPLVLVLDEPTAALDPEAEHALFKRYAAAMRETASSGSITILVSHRFSTVRAADLIVVLDGRQVVESGTHEALLVRQGHYAQLYGIQAAAYS